MLVRTLSWHKDRSGIFIYIFTRDDKDEFRIIKVREPECWYSNVSSDNLNAQAVVSSVTVPDMMYVVNPDFDHLAEAINTNLWNKDNTSPIKSLIRNRHLDPYGWMRVDNYNPNSSDENTTYMSLHPSNNHNPVTIIKMYWDIETLSKTDNFTTPDQEDSEIRLITIIGTFTHDDKITGYNAFVLVVTNNTITVDVDPNAKVYSCVDEKDLISKFFSIWSHIYPDYVIQYNGYSFDIPFMVIRAQKYGLNLPNIGRMVAPVRGIYSSKRRYRTTFSVETSTTWIVPGTENIDLLYYFRKYYPYLNNHKLDTVCKYILSKGKTDMTIKEMFKIMRSDDPNGMEAVVKYSYIDTYLLYLLDTKLNIVTHLEKVCNDLLMTMEEFLSCDDIMCCKSLCYKIDIGSLILPFRSDEFTGIQQAKGIYRNVGCYNYSDLLLDKISGDVSCMSYNERCMQEYMGLRDAPSSVIVTYVMSNYVDVDVITSTIESIGNILSINKHYYVKYLEESSNLIDKEDIRFVFDRLNYVAIRDNNIVRYGLASIVRPMFPYVKSYVDKSLISIANGSTILDYNGITKDNLDEFAIETKVKPSKTYKGNGIKKILSKAVEQSGWKITSWVTIRYFVLTDSYWIIDETSDKRPDISTVDVNYYDGVIHKIQDIILGI